MLRIRTGIKTGIKTGIETGIETGIKTMLTDRYFAISSSGLARFSMCP